MLFLGVLSMYVGVGAMNQATAKLSDLELAVGMHWSTVLQDLRTLQLLARQRH